MRNIAGPSRVSQSMVYANAYAIKDNSVRGHQKLRYDCLAVPYDCMLT